MPQDSIMLWVANEESFYNDLHGMYDQWVEQGDTWDESDARKEAEALAAHIAEAIEAFEFTEGKYTKDEIREAADEMLEDFEDYREESITEAVKNASMKPKPEDLVMTPEDIEYAKKQEKMVVAVGVSTLPSLLDHPVNISVEEARQAGIEHIRGYIPVSASRIRQALERGDKPLNTIPLRKWDEAARQMGYRHIRGPQHLPLSLSDAVGVLKHVAKWHYA